MTNCDSQSYLHFVDYEIYHEWTKHIDVAPHFIRDVESGEARLQR